MIEVIEIDGNRVSLGGDYFETLVYPEADAGALLEFLSSRIQADEINLLRGGATPIIEIKAQAFLEPELVAELKANFPIRGLEKHRAGAAGAVA